MSCKLLEVRMKRINHEELCRITPVPDTLEKVEEHVVI